MRGQTIGCLLVVDQGKLVGLVTTTHLLDQLGRGATLPSVRTEPAPVRRAPASAAYAEKKAIRRATGPREAVGSAPRPQRRSRFRFLPTGQGRRGRTFDVSPPAHVRVIGASLDQEYRDEAARKLGMKLGKFASSIERVSVRLFDANGPKGASIRYAGSRWSCADSQRVGA